MFSVWWEEIMIKFDVMDVEIVKNKTQRNGINHNIDGMDISETHWTHKCK